MQDNPALQNSRIAGAVALAIIDDLKDNTFSFSGFPMIDVTQETSQSFKITLSFAVKNTIVSHQLRLTEEVALKTESIFKNKKSYPREIFDAVQEAVAQLESKIYKSRLS
ncbi:hypothetical protein AAIP73_002737 [Yersinia ruckeri]|uniref:hypothetical protein n=1 Tax=Yersinia ruckeri TaxID=29486 RepID=UPI002237B37F|nr:hypothetical protein [Yersinia ruckeri]EKN4700040.1 hypothetical protein [Yersinia ruckeri]ELM3741003.1 hypothetical protein [Yersinia ruckeri]ELM3747766.1 hypothetical protein [Yersinia ruckeri]MCW6635548.1 hypothetical protein [Yersinia ruckeri]MCW6636917.1 hypothetical protein [Yersinia ruckeri]